VLRDQIERNAEKHNVALSKAKLQLQERAKSLNMSTHDLIELMLRIAFESKASKIDKL
jgi:hypothetical protein